MKSMNVGQLAQMISRLLHRFHVILFVVMVVGGLSLVTLFLNLAISKPANDIPSGADQPFDEATMTKINNLRTTSDQSTLTPPAGRINPFLKK